MTPPDSPSKSLSPKAGNPSSKSLRAARQARSIAQWFSSHGRPLPWRVTPRDPYLSLLSEFMLQQTQVSRVLELLPLFTRSFPTIESLAAAPLERVLALWSGLGYYQRVRNLHAAAQHVVTRFGGNIPSQISDLQSLPGVGRYTAGALSSIVFQNPVPIVDGNVSRVLMRLRGRPFAHGSTEGTAWAWKEAESLITAAARAKVNPALLNEGLMELGAVVCTPRSPLCSQCPVSRSCHAFRDKAQDTIPLPKARTRQSRRFCESILMFDAKGRVLVEQRPSSGMWAGLWQAPTWERTGRAARAPEVEAWIGLPVTRHLRFDHTTTHRQIRFTLWKAHGSLARKQRTGRKFIAPEKLPTLGLSSPQQRILLGLAR